MIMKRRLKIFFLDILNDSFVSFGCCLFLKLIYFAYLLANDTLFTLAPWPWPSHGRARFCLHWASFTLAKLVNLAKTVSVRISARVKCKHSLAERAFLFICSIINLR